MRRSLLFLVLALVVVPLIGLGQDSAVQSDPQIADLIRRLGDTAFKTREEASGALLKMGESARPHLQKAAQDSDDLEVRSRAVAILEQLDQQAIEKKRRELLEQTLAARKDAKTPAFDPARLRDLVEKKGKIKASEKWTADKSYRITGPLSVASGATLTVEPGVVVLIDGPHNIDVEKGAVLAARSNDAGKPIILTALAERDRKDGHWGQIVCRGSLQFENVQVRRSGGVRVMGAGSLLLDLGIFHTAGDALTVDKHHGKHERLTIREASGNGLVFGPNTYPTITKLTVSACAVGIRCNDSSYPTLTDVFVHDAKGQGVLLTEDSYPRLIQLTVVGCDTGLHITNGSYPRIKALSVMTCLRQGVLVDDNSDPEIEEVTLQSIEGTGMVVRGSSNVRVGKMTATDCKQGESFVEQGSRIRPWREKKKP